MPDPHASFVPQQHQPKAPVEGPVGARRGIGLAHLLDGVRPEYLVGWIGEEGAPFAEIPCCGSESSGRPEPDRPELNRVEGGLGQRHIGPRWHVVTPSLWKPPSPTQGGGPQPEGVEDAAPHRGIPILVVEACDELGEQPAVGIGVGR